MSDNCSRESDQQATFTFLSSYDKSCLHGPNASYSATSPATSATCLTGPAQVIDGTPVTPDLRHVELQTPRCLVPQSIFIPFNQQLASTAGLLTSTPRRLVNSDQQMEDLNTWLPSGSFGTCRL